MKRIKPLFITPAGGLVKRFNSELINHCAAHARLTAEPLVIRSNERDPNSLRKTLATTHPFTSTRAAQAPPATRIEFMGETSLEPLKAILQTIRERADYALKQIQDAQEQRSMRWKCKDCDYMKHFTRAVPLEATGRCPRCKSISFEAID